MGFRTVVILNNDLAGQWEKDAELGKKISHASAAMAIGMKSAANFDGGRVVQSVHADTQTLAVIDSLQFTPVTHSVWYASEDAEDVKLKLLKYAASELGYTLTKKRKKKF